MTEQETIKILEGEIDRQRVVIGHLWAELNDAREAASIWRRRYGAVKEKLSLALEEIETLRAKNEAMAGSLINVLPEISKALPDMVKALPDKSLTSDSETLARYANYTIKDITQENTELRQKIQQQDEIIAHLREQLKTPIEQIHDSGG